jgi:PAS domain-containing protein
MATSPLQRRCERPPMAHSAATRRTQGPYPLAPGLRALLEDSPDAVLLVDRAGRILALNRRV